MFTVYFILLLFVHNNIIFETLRSMALNSSTAAAMVGSFAASYEIWLVS